MGEGDWTDWLGQVVGDAVGSMADAGTAVMGMEGPAVSMVTDTLTGETMTLAQAYALDPQGLYESLQVADPANAGQLFQQAQTEAATTAGSTSALSGIPGQPGAATPPAPNVPLVPPGSEGVFSSLMQKLGQDPMKALQLAGGGVMGVAGLATMLKGLTASGNTVQVGNRQIQLTPQESQLLGYVTNQANAQAQVAGAINPAVQGAAVNAASPIQSTLTQGAQTGAVQAQGQKAVANASTGVVAGAAPTAYGGDVNTALGMQPVQAAAVKSLADLGPTGDYTPAQFQSLQPTMQQANTVVQQGLAGNVAADPGIETLRQKELATLDEQSKLALGPGYNYATPYINAKNLINQKYDLMTTQDIRNQVQLAQGIVGQNAQFLQGASQQGYTNTAGVAGSTGSATDLLNKVFGSGQTGAPTPAGGTSYLLGNNAANLGLTGLASLAPIGSSTESLGTNAAIANAGLANQKNTGTAQLGGTLTGFALSPFVSSYNNAFKAIS